MVGDGSELLVVRDDRGKAHRQNGVALLLGSTAGLVAAGYLASRQSGENGGVIFGCALLVFGGLLIWGLSLLFMQRERHAVDRKRRELVIEVWGHMHPRVRHIPAHDIREITLLTSRNRKAGDNYDSITETENMVAVWRRDGEMIAIGHREVSRTADAPPSPALDELRLRVCEALGLQAGPAAVAATSEGQAPPSAIDHDSVRLDEQFNRLARIDPAAQRIEINSHPDNAARRRVVIGMITFAVAALLLPPIFGLTNLIVWLVLALMIAVMLLMAAAFSPVDEERLTIDRGAKSVSRKTRQLCFGYERYAERTIPFAEIVAIAQGAPSKATPVTSTVTPLKIDHHLQYWVSPVGLRLRSGEEVPLYTRGWYAAAPTAPDPLLAALRGVLSDVPVVPVASEVVADPPSR